MVYKLVPGLKEKELKQELEFLTTRAISQSYLPRIAEIRKLLRKKVENDQVCGVLLMFFNFKELSNNFDFEVFSIDVYFYVQTSKYIFLTILNTDFIIK